MRLQLFLSGVTVIALGVMAMSGLPRDAAAAMLQGTLTLGGALLICALFSLRMDWHGVIGAGVVALLGAARGAGNLPNLMKWLSGDRSRGSIPLHEAAITLVCLILLARVIAALRREKIRRMLEQG